VSNLSNLQLFCNGFGNIAMCCYIVALSQILVPFLIRKWIQDFGAETSCKISHVGSRRNAM